MDGAGLGSLKVAEFERNARDTDKLGQELETAGLGLYPCPASTGSLNVLDPRLALR
jgi:hypothetical protein